MPIGIYGTVPHILTNKKLDSKKAALKDSVKEYAKGTGKLLLAEAAVLGGAAGATVAVDKFCPTLASNIRSGLSGIKSHVGSILEQVPVSVINENGYVNAKEAIKGTGIIEAMKAIPAPLKAAAVASIAILPSVMQYIGAKTMANGAAAEARHEVK